MPAVNNIDPAAFQRLQQEAPVTLVDVRTDAEVARGMIAGAVHIPLHLLPARCGELDPAAELVVYCQSGGRSAQACAWLSDQGYARVRNLAGGVAAWLREGHSLVAPG